MAGPQQVDERRWRWIASRSIGTSHIRTGDACEDNVACVEWNQSGKSVLIAAVSDGAGSAEFAEVGSRLVTLGIVRAIWKHLSLERARPIDDACVEGWLDTVRDAIGAAAESKGRAPRDFAATLVCAVAFEHETIVLHIGDGACVAQSADGAWHTLSWPENGEYASTTYFITDDPVPRLRLGRYNERFDRLALFSDGMERLALSFAERTASPRFFEPMFAPLLKTDKSGRDRSLSRQLKSFLDSDHVGKFTDDDKSLIIAARGVA